MKALLFIALLTFSLCAEEQLVGGWKKRSIYENSLEIEEAFKTASKHYIKKNKGVEPDDLLHLTVYSQLVNGMLYKVTFIDSLAEFPVVQEYKILKTQSNNRNEDPYTVESHIEYEANEGLIPFNDEKFTMLEFQLYRLLKDTNEKLNFISYVYPVENDETNFFIISAYTDDGEHQYVICQDKENDEFYAFSKIK